MVTNNRATVMIFVPGDLDLWPFHLWVNACRATAIEYTCTKIAVDISSRVPVRARTNRQTDRQTDTDGRDWTPYPRRRICRRGVSDNNITCRCDTVDRQRSICSRQHSSSRCSWQRTVHRCCCTTGSWVLKTCWNSTDRGMCNLDSRRCRSSNGPLWQAPQL